MDEFQDAEWMEIRSEFYRMAHYIKEGWKLYFTPEDFEKQRLLMMPFFIARAEHLAYIEDDERTFHLSWN
jgi:hypothetical protein